MAGLVDKMVDFVERYKAIECVENTNSSMSVCLNKDYCDGASNMKQRVIKELAALPNYSMKKYLDDYKMKLTQLINQQNELADRDITDEGRCYHTGVKQGFVHAIHLLDELFDLSDGGKKDE